MCMAWKDFSRVVNVQFRGPRRDQETRWDFAHDIPLLNMSADLGSSLICLANLSSLATSPTSFPLSLHGPLHSSLNQSTDLSLLHPHQRHVNLGVLAGAVLPDSSYSSCSVCPRDPAHGPSCQGHRVSTSCLLQFLGTVDLAQCSPQRHWLHMIKEQVIIPCRWPHRSPHVANKEDEVYRG